MGPTQYDQIGLFWFIFGHKFSCKSSQSNFKLFGQFWKTALLSKDYCGYQLGNRCKNWARNMIIPTCGHTALTCQIVLVSALKLRQKMFYSIDFRPHLFRQTPPPKSRYDQTPFTRFGKRSLNAFHHHVFRWGPVLKIFHHLRTSRWFHYSHPLLSKVQIQYQGDIQKTLTIGGRITVMLVWSFTRLDSTASLHTNNIFSYFWSNSVLLNRRPVIQWSLTSQCGL